VTSGQARFAGAFAATAWLVAWVIADIRLDEPGVAFTVLFALSPLIAAAVFSPFVTGGYAVAAIAAAVGSGGWDNAGGTPQQLIRLSDVIAVSIASVVVSAVREQRDRRFSRVSAIADAAQRAMLPVLPDHIDTLEIAARYRSSTAEALVGGDFYDLVALDSRIRIVIGDVRGKGLEAVQHAARAIRAFRQWGSIEQDLAMVAVRMHDYMSPFLGDEDFVTALILQVERDGSVSVVNCGHPAPLLITTSGLGHLDVDTSTPPLGLLTEPPRVTRSSWPIEARLLLYTDGLVEARNDDGEFLPTRRIHAAGAHQDTQAGLDALLAEVTQHSGGRFGDDIALVLLQRAPTAA
jgi:sigma-B regulation protein RsbU (phosphoserine phosphatase)